MAKKERSEKEQAAEELSFQRETIRVGMRRNGFRAGDVLLVVLAIAVTALMIILGARVIPSLRESLSSYNEELLFTVEYPISLTDTLPQSGDGWTLLDSDGRICIVRLVEFSAEEGICRVMLYQKNAEYREDVGYSIGNTRISVGSTVYFCGVSDRYFAATVLSLESKRFPPPVYEETGSEDSTDTDGAGKKEELNE